MKEKLRRSHLVGQVGRRYSWGLMILVVIFITSVGYLVVHNSHAASLSETSPSSTVLPTHVPEYRVFGGSEVTATELGFGTGLGLAVVVLIAGAVTVRLTRKHRK